MTTRRQPELTPEPIIPAYQIAEQTEINSGIYIKATCGEHETELYWASDTRQPDADDIKTALDNWASRL